LPERFDIEMLAYVLMPNHYHLQLRTQDANLSQAIHWLNVNYSVWFNRKYDRVGPLFQGRFKAILHDPSAALTISNYIHLNPARTAAVGGRELEFAPDAKITDALRRGRVTAMEQYPWSSYAYFGGLKPAPEWLNIDAVLDLIGQGPERKRQQDLWQELRRVAALGEWEMDSNSQSKCAILPSNNDSCPERVNS
jgi:hypothetical protein